MEAEIQPKRYYVLQVHFPYFLTDRNYIYTCYIVHSSHYRDLIHDTKLPKCTILSLKVSIMYYNINI